MSGAGGLIGSQYALNQVAPSRANGRLGLIQRFEDVAVVVAPETPGVTGEDPPVTGDRQLPRQARVADEEHEDRSLEDHFSRFPGGFDQHSGLAERSGDSAA